MNSGQDFQAACLAQRQGDLPRARALFEKVVRREPDHFDASQMLAVIELAEQRPERALEHLSRCLAIDPDFVPVLSNAAVAHNRLRRPDAAIRLARRAVALRPDHTESWTVLGSALRELDQLGPALAAQQRAVRLKPEGATARYNAAILRLMQGDLAGGWPDFPFRFQARPDAGVRDRGLPAWDGDVTHTERPLLIWAEQGVGDELVFASCVPDLAQRRGPVIIECDRRLQALFQRSFPFAACLALDEPLPAGAASAVQVPSGGLAQVLRPSLAAFPPRARFLAADAQKAARWRQRLADLGAGRKVGVLWRGLVRAPERDHRYTRIEQWGDILAVPGVRFIGLQYGDRSGETPGDALHFFDDLDLRDALDDVAALMSVLDLIISPGTAGFALGAAVGCPTWVLSSADDWLRLGTNAYPWLPGARAFVKAPGADWQSSLRDVGQALRAFAG